MQSFVIVYNTCFSLLQVFLYSGKVSVKQLLLPILDVTFILPPNFSIIDLVMGNPNPDPEDFVSSAFLPFEKNGVNI